jgi:hypothetical protein
LLFWAIRDPTIGAYSAMLASRGARGPGPTPDRFLDFRPVSFRLGRLVIFTSPRYSHARNRRLDTEQLV